MRRGGRDVVDGQDDERNRVLDSARIDSTVPASARIWNYWMGGKDNYAVDRLAGDAWAEVNPEIVNEARQSRQFLIRVVQYLAGETGIRQFLDIGTGLPTMQNTHEVAQGIAPESRIVYVDNDPMVLAHARALLTNTTPGGVTTYLDADARNPERIIADAHNVLNFNEPIAVMFMGILGHLADYDEARSIVSRVMTAVPSGSHLALYDGVNTDEAKVEAETAYADTGAIAYHNRSPEQISRFFEGLELIPPGLISISQWRPDGETVKPTGSYGAVARKP
ncbi:SAM-dependent methyltransferase [Saccharopolyspora sp. K220]|uniref:SAM-dependent methyltransferase n=1 Tax=Saccharopolyspora soli TaxID=2926618 RepID=UPI001F565805|nr:SAM-dependent methyltransferase [Saccharopolyspora soli]MCI2422225.1 SAM-dependent methyltransferase [Saccharopolyspora soli]